MAYENRDYTHLSEEEKQKIELIAQAIRNKAYGIDVRESIALAIEWVNREYKLTIENNILTLKEFENAKSKVSTLELDMDEFIKRYSEQIAGNTSLDETIDARVDATGVSHTTLKDRLDKEHQEVTAQLAQMFTNVKNYGAKGDGITDDTTAIQNAIDQVSNQGGGIVYVPNGVYMVEASGSGDYSKGKGLVLRDNIHLLLSEGATIQAIPTSQSNYKVLNILDVENVTIEGGTIKGERDDHLGTTGEWGMNISIEGSKNITLRDVESSNAWGDGLYISSSENKNYSENIYLEKTVFSNNRRQGISVISVKGIFGQNVICEKTNGTLPEAGIDFEPNHDYQILEDIYFDGLKTLNNAGSGVLFSMRYMTASYKINGTFNQLSSEGDQQGVAILSFRGTSEGNLVFNNPLITNSKGAGIRMRGISKEFSKVIFNSPTIIDYNMDKLERVYGSGVCVSMNSTDPQSNFKMGNFEINNPYIREYGTKTTSDFIFQNEVAGGKQEVFQNIKITGAPTKEIYGSQRLTDSKIETVEPFIIDVTGTAQYPIEQSTFYNEVNVSGKEETVLTLLTPTPEHNIPTNVTVKYLGGSGEKLTIRPEAGKRMSPLTFSKSNGKGMEISSYLEADAYVTFRYHFKTWRIVDMLGGWVAEE